MAKLNVIPEPAPDTRSVLRMQGEGTVVIRVEDAERPVHTCGACDAPLIVGLGLLHIQNVVLRCNGCGAFNETTDPGPARPALN